MATEMLSFRVAAKHGKPLVWLHAFARYSSVTLELSNGDD